MSNMGKGAGYYLTRSKSLLIDTAIVAILAIFMSFAMQMDALQSKGEDYLSECGWNLLSVSFIAALMYDGFSTLYTGAFLAFALIIGIMLVRTDASRGKMVRLLFGIAAIILSFFNFQILPAISCTQRRIYL